MNTNCTATRSLTLRIALTIASGLSVAAVGGQGSPPAERAAAIKQSIAQNQAALRQYAWIETTEISVKGDVKKTEQKQCYYGADGKVQKTPLPGAGQQSQPAQQGRSGRGSRLKQAVVEKKVSETKDYMDQVAALVQQYVPPDPQKLQAAQSAGNLTVDADSGAGGVRVKDYLKTGDLVAIGFDPAAKKLSSYTVNSYVEKPKEDDVTLAVTFASLTDGTSYPQQVVLDAKAKAIQVKVTNSGYKKAGP